MSASSPRPKSAKPLARRRFLQAAAAAPLAAIATEAKAEEPLRKNFNEVESRRTCRAKVAIIDMGRGDWFRPTRWSDIPDGGTIIEIDHAKSLADARRQVKCFNSDWRTKRPRLSQGQYWAIVVCTDGRRARRKEAC